MAKTSVKRIEEEDLYGQDDVNGTADGEITKPFNPKAVDIVSETMVIANIIDRLKDGRIDLEPDFQRSVDLWDEKKQSRLIESLVVRIPLPSFYFDYDDTQDRYIVVDGLQRLWSIKKFTALDANNPQRLRLTGLEYLSEYEGKKFEDLPPVIQRRIRETAVIVYVIRPGTPEYVRNSIFTRINTGGIQLNAAEIRNSVYRGQAANLLKELAHSDLFVKATDHRIDSSRMMDRELVNRFLAFYVLDQDQYKGNLDMYLNDVLMKLKQAPPKQLDAYKEPFFRAMETAIGLFGKTAFRKIQKNGKYGLLNKPLFECISVCLARLNKHECGELLIRKDQFLKMYDELLHDPDFDKVITNGTARKASIEKRYNEVNRIIRETIR